MAAVLTADDQDRRSVRLGACAAAGLLWGTSSSLSAFFLSPGLQYKPVVSSVHCELVYSIIMALTLPWLMASDDDDVFLQAIRSEHQVKTQNESDRTIAAKEAGGDPQLRHLRPLDGMPAPVLTGRSGRATSRHSADDLQRGVFVG